MKPDRRQMPLWFSLLFVGQFAGFLFAAGLLAATGLSEAAFVTTLTLLAPATLVATIIIAPLYLSLHALLSAIRFTNGWVYMVGSLICFTGLYILSFDFIMPMGSDPLRDRFSEILAHPIKSLVYLVPLIALPTALLFHFLALRANLAQPFSPRDRFIAATWVATWLALGLSHYLVELSHDLQIGPTEWRREAVRWASLFVMVALPVGGLIAGFLRLKNEKASLAIARLSWTGVAVLAAAYGAVLSRPRLLEYTVADQTYAIPLRYEPRREQNGFSFDAAGLGPFAGRSIGNERLYVSAPEVPLQAGLAGSGFVDPHRPAPAEITKSKEGEFEVERYTDKLNRPRRNYYILGCDGQPVTRIQCEAGYCFHCFLDAGVRYCLHGEPDAYVRWRDAQRQSASLLAKFRRQD